MPPWEGDSTLAAGKFMSAKEGLEAGARSSGIRQPVEKVSVTIPAHRLINRRVHQRAARVATATPDTHRVAAGSVRRPRERRVLGAWVPDLKGVRGPERLPHRLPCRTSRARVPRASVPTGWSTSWNASYTLDRRCSRLSSARAWPGRGFRIAPLVRGQLQDIWPDVTDLRPRGPIQDVCSTAFQKASEAAKRKATSRFSGAVTPSTARTGTATTRRASRTFR